MWPVNSAVNSDILEDDFYSTVERAQKARFYPRLSRPEPLSEIVNTITTLGSVPNIRRLSGVSGGGERQAIPLKDWSLVATVYEWEQTIPIRKLFAKSKPEAVRAKTTQMAAKAQKGMDGAFCEALTSTTALGADGVALLSTAHPESGTNQSNLVTGANITTNFVPTAAEAEAMLQSAVSGLRAFQDDQGTPVNEGIDRFVLLCPQPMEIPFMRILDPQMSNQAVDASGGTGVYRGKFEVIPSAYATATGLVGGALDRIFVFAKPEEYSGTAMGLGELADWEFNTNIGDDHSDDWNNGEGYLRSWAAFVFFPREWQSVMCHIVT